MKLGGWLIMLTALIMIVAVMGMNTGLNSTLAKLGVNVTSTGTVVSADVESSTFWDKLFSSSGFLVAISGLGLIVTIGMFARGYDPSLILLPFVIFVAGLYIQTFYSLFNYTKNFNQWWLTSIIGIISTALAVGFIMASVDYFGGR